MTVRNWGMVGGGKGSQIGGAHRIGSSMDGAFRMAAGALDVDPKAGRKYAMSLGVAADRAYGSWQDMLAAEREREDGIELVTIATPNATHYEIAKAFLDAGIHVLCEKPLTMTVKEAVALEKLADKKRCVLAVNFGYTGYPMVREARTMVRRGKLGAIRLVVAEFAHGHHADAADADNPRVRWRYDPAQAGVSSVLADCGIHALQMAEWVTGQRSAELSAHFLSAIPSRELEDDAALQISMDGGATCRLWSSAVALGHQHGLTLQVFGEKGGISWAQEHPNQLLYTALNKPTQIIERGSPGLAKDTVDSTRIAVGHPEGMVSAFANVYRDLAGALDGKSAALDRLPSAADGVAMVRVVQAAAKSAKSRGRWVSV
jgi:predicted dehydrogenase